MTARANAPEQAAFAEAAGLPLFTKGLPPLDRPLLAAAIESRLREQQIDKRNFRGRVHFSDAGACARKIGFGSIGVPKTHYTSPEGLVAFEIGKMYHRLVQDTAAEWLSAKSEFPGDWRPMLSLTGYGDAVYQYALLETDPRTGQAIDPDDKSLVLIEAKSMAGYGFRLAVGTSKSKELPGPKAEHLTQGGMAALAPDIAAERIHVIYLDKDKNTSAEWLIHVDEPLPHLGGTTVRRLVEDERERFVHILADLDRGDLPARDVPGFGIVDNPPEYGERGAQPWNCAYCPWRDLCASLPTGVVSGWVADFLRDRGEAA
jgi:hypothetical protein